MCFESRMRSADVVMQTRKLVERLRGEHQASKASGPAWLKKSQRAVLQLAESHPQQMGAMLPLLLNYLLVAPGEAFYVARARAARASRASASRSVLVAIILCGSDSPRILMWRPP